MSFVESIALSDNCTAHKSLIFRLISVLSGSASCQWMLSVLNTFLTNWRIFIGRNRYISALSTLILIFQARTTIASIIINLWIIEDLSVNISIFAMARRSEVHFSSFLVGYLLFFWGLDLFQIDQNAIILTRGITRFVFNTEVNSIAVSYIDELTSFEIWCFLTLGDNLITVTGRRVSVLSVILGLRQGVGRIILIWSICFVDSSTENHIHILARNRIGILFKGSWVIHFWLELILIRMRIKMAVIFIVIPIGIDIEGIRLRYPRLRIGQ